MGLTRSTVGPEVYDPREQALSDLLHWVWSWRVQLERLVESTQAQGQAEHPTDSRKSFSRASLDEHLLVVVGGHLTKAASRGSECFPALGPTLDQAEPLILLRNLYEHWDEQRPAFQDPSVPKHKSGKRLAELCPDARPWSITYAPGEWLLGGVLRLSELTAALMRLEEAALQLETTYLAEKRRSRTTRS